MRFRGCELQFGEKTMQFGECELHVGGKESVKFKRCELHFGGKENEVQRVRTSFGVER